jgi:hypothetical protein
MTLLNYYTNLRSVELWFELGSSVSDYQSFVSLGMLACSNSVYDGILVYIITPYLNPIRIRGSSYPSTLATTRFSLLSLCPDGQRSLYIG